MTFATKWTLGILLLVGLLIGGGTWIALSRAEETLARHEREAREVLAAATRRVIERPPVDPWPAGRDAAQRPTDAWPIYAQALGAIAAIPDGDLETLPENRYDRDTLQEIDEEAVHAFVVAHHALIDDLLPALHADRIRADPGLAAGDATQQLADLPAWQSLHRFLQGAARNALARDDGAAVARLVPLRLCLGLDYALQGTVMHVLVGEATALAAVDELRALLARELLDPATLATLARRLDLLAGRQPRVDWRLEYADARNNVVGAVRRGEDLLEQPPGWRSLWSQRIFAADGLDALGAITQRLAGLEALPLAEAARRVQALVDELGEDVHPLAQAWVALSPLIVQRVGVFETHLHLARTAVALARFRAEHGAWPGTLEGLVPAYLERIEDGPFTGRPLGYHDGKLWSVGGDGDDDGGRPQAEDADWEADGDVVWDLGDRTLPDPFAWAR